MKNIESIIISISTILLGLLVVSPSFAKSVPSALFSDIHKSVVFRDGDISMIIRDFSTLNNSEMIPDFVSHHICDEVKLLSSVSTKRESVTYISPTKETGRTPECRKYECRQGLTDQEWEKGFHMFFLYFFVIPFLSTLAGIIAGISGWIRFS
ncbi:MAG: hypothetical protein LZT29_00657 [Pantoea stewartii]|uniref:hypothetical protein n=1 Tax=Pantoea stewartii TaxID=66269 RepID=UPI000A49A357|nr:hypothetical protein [Pantoea stewartii]WHS97780.1 MAG: hypothetical protein LZT29_00657 [Pantoea stewartii]